MRFDAGGSAIKQRTSGFGDLQILGRYTLRQGKGFATNLDIEGGLLLPTGQSSLSMDLLGAQATPNILSIGRGAFGTRAHVTANRFVHKDWALRTWLSFSAPLSRNSSHVLFGKQFKTGLGVSYLLGKSFIIAPQISASHVTHSKSNRGQLINSGGSWLHTELIGAWRASDDISLSVTARLPLYRDVNGSQITESFTGLMQLSYRWGETKKEDAEDTHDHGAQDEHNHDDTDKHQSQDEPHTDSQQTEPTASLQLPKSGDIVEAATGGASFDKNNIAVPGKITIVDFWAKWCAPCGPLTKGLTEMVHADLDLALRKVEVPSFDSPLAKEHLASAKGLPVVWIYDMSGKLTHRLIQKNLEEIRTLILAMKK